MKLRAIIMALFSVVCLATVATVAEAQINSYTWHDEDGLNGRSRWEFDENGNPYIEYSITNDWGQAYMVDIVVEWEAPNGGIFETTIYNWSMIGPCQMTTVAYPQATADTLVSTFNTLVTNDISSHAGTWHPKSGGLYYGSPFSWKGSQTGNTNVYYSSYNGDGIDIAWAPGSCWVVNMWLDLRPVL